jgi:lysine 2,3-aminomutase
MASVKVEHPAVAAAPEVITSTGQGRRSPIGDYHKVALWKDVADEQWEDWHWQIKNRITTLDQISKVLILTPEEEEGIRKSRGRLSMAITPYWMTQMDASDPGCPIRRQAIPSKEEFVFAAKEFIDPCAEDRDSPVSGLVHRYPDRVLLLGTEQCAMDCRPCTRRRRVGAKAVSAISETTMDAAVG